MASRLPLRRVFEPEPGFSSARNAAVRHATGDYIVRTDDDVIVDKDWLPAYERAVERWPEAVVLAGRPGEIRRYASDVAVRSLLRHRGSVCRAGTRRASV
jgi:glycosyltransferase involved in cell wall biosynthesis